MKWFAIVGMVLFLGVAVAPSINAATTHEIQKQTEIIVLNNLTSKTTSITVSEKDALSLQSYLDAFAQRLNMITCEHELQLMLDELEDTFYRYGIKLSLNDIYDSLPETAFIPASQNTSNSNCLVISNLPTVSTVFQPLVSRILRYHYENQVQRALNIWDTYNSLPENNILRLFLLPLIYFILIYAPLINLLFVDPGIIVSTYEIFNGLLRGILPGFNIEIQNILSYGYLYTFGSQGKQQWNQTFNAMIYGFKSIKVYPNVISIFFTNLPVIMALTIGYARKVEVSPLRL
ncbi:MAG: hypothetical protein KKC68_04890 [Candidatus Thermoplasmatota archaeon]|nr:hypothetical protein [Candidatus Thermoplasmatota archaeon]